MRQFVLLIIITENCSPQRLGAGGVVKVVGASGWPRQEKVALDEMLLVKVWWKVWCAVVNEWRRMASSNRLKRLMKSLSGWHIVSSPCIAVNVNIMWVLYWPHVNGILNLFKNSPKTHVIWLEASSFFHEISHSAVFSSSITINSSSMSFSLNHTSSYNFSMFLHMQAYEVQMKVLGIFIFEVWLVEIVIANFSSNQKYVLINLMKQISQT